MIFRADLNLTPEFSVRYYGSPFVSRGTYSEIKRITYPRAERYDDRFELFEDPVLSGGKYNIFDNASGTRAEYSIDNPDSNFYQFRSNFVARCEYRPGSYIYPFWSANKTGRSSYSETSIMGSYKQLRDVFPNNIFLIKINYWFSI